MNFSDRVWALNQKYKFRKYGMDRFGETTLINSHKVFLWCDRFHVDRMYLCTQFVMKYLLL